MVEDVSQGISFVCKNIANYGGDPERLIAYTLSKYENLAIPISISSLLMYILHMYTHGKYCASFMNQLVWKVR
jgi:hypothetical protein